MHYAVCSIVCAVSLCLCPTLSQYLFSLITMGACCGCLDGFFGRLLFRSAAFVFRRWLSMFCLCWHVCESASCPYCTCPHALRDYSIDEDRGGRTGHYAHFSFLSRWQCVHRPFMFFFHLGSLLVCHSDSSGFSLSRVLHTHRHVLIAHWQLNTFSSFTSSNKER